MATVRLDFYDLDENAVPDLCMKCGEPAVTHKEKNFSWHPQWVAVLILVGLLPYILVALILTKRRRVSIPFCEAHKNHWMWRGLVALAGFGVVLLLFVGGIVAAAYSGPNGAGADDFVPYFFLSAVAGLLVWLITVAVIFSTAISVSEITDRDITLKNVSPEFARAYDEERRGFAPRIDRGAGDPGGRRPRYDDRDEGYRRPEARRPPDDSYERG